jgi:bifunctional enzyme CysN/CysC
LRRVAHIAKILNDQGIIAICSFISPSEDIRNQCDQIIGEDRFHLVHVDANLEFCMTNKPELYQKFEKGKLKHLPGLDDVYEKPKNPVLVSNHKNIQKNTEEVIDYILKQNIFHQKQN